jgi:hypothetical protein
MPTSILKQRIVAPVIDTEVLHDRMKVEADHAKVAYRVLRLVDRELSHGRLHRAPCADHAIFVSIAHTRDIVVGAGQCRDRRR